MSEFGIVTTTVDTPEQAQKLASALVDAQLAACVQTQTVTSTYTWQGKLETTNELLLKIKTMSNLFGEVEAKIRALHSYDTPEIAFTNMNGSSDYLDWIRNSVKRASFRGPHHLP